MDVSSLIVEGREGWDLRDLSAPSTAQSRYLKHRGYLLHRSLSRYNNPYQHLPLMYAKYMYFMELKFYFLILLYSPSK